MRLVTRVDQRAPIHRVDAHNDTEKICPLANLINARLALTTLGFDAHFPRAGEDLSSDEKRQNTGDDLVPRDIASHQVIVVATVTVSGKVGIVLVEANFVIGWQLLISPACALRQDALTRLVLCDYLAKRCALWCGIFRVRVIIVEAGAVRKHKVAFYFLKTQWAAFIDLVISRFIGVLEQFARTKTACIQMGIFKILVP